MMREDFMFQVSKVNSNRSCHQLKQNSAKPRFELG